MPILKCLFPWAVLIGKPGLFTFIHNAEGTNRRKKMLALNKASKGLSLMWEPIQDQLMREAMSQLTFPPFSHSRQAAALAKLHRAESLRDSHLLVSDQIMKGAAAATSSVPKKALQECKSLRNMSVQGLHVESHTGVLDVFLW